MERAGLAVLVGRDVAGELGRRGAIELEEDFRIGGHDAEDPAADVEGLIVPDLETHLVERNARLGRPGVAAERIDEAEEGHPGQRRLPQPEEQDGEQRQDGEPPRRREPAHVHRAG